MVTEIKQWPPAIQLDNEVEAYRPEGLIEYVDADLAPATNEVLLGSLRDGRLRVYSPIKVTFAREGTHAIAEAVDINEFGFGANPSEALADLQNAIAELYLTLEVEQNRLGDDLQSVWAVLQEKIYKR